MATFEKRPGVWRVKIRQRGVSRSASFRTKAQAQAWAAMVEAEIVAGRLGEMPDKSLRELLERYRDEVTVGKRGERPERLRIEAFLRDDELVRVQLGALSPADIEGWMRRRLKSVQPGTVLRDVHILSHACNMAIRWGWLRENPVSSAVKPSEPAPRGRRVSHDEIDRLLLACGYEYDVAPETATARVGAAFLFALETAMRSGEICALTWENVDLNRRVAHLPMTKNGHARVVPLSKEAVRLLEQMKQVRDEGAPVFRLTDANRDALFRKIRARAMVDGLHFHDTRREALTRMAAKVDVMTLAKISGHRDLRILQNTYYAPDMGDVASRLD